MRRPFGRGRVPATLRHLVEVPHDIEGTVEEVGIDIPFPHHLVGFLPGVELDVRMAPADKPGDDEPGDDGESADGEELSS